MKHLPILNTPGRAPALRRAAPRCPRAEMHTYPERHRQARLHARLSAERHSVLSSSLAGEKGRNTPPPEELLHVLGARFQGRQSQGCMPLFLSSPTTKSSGTVIANAVPARHTPLSGSRPWIHTGIATASPTASTPSGCMSACSPPNPKPGTWQGASCTAPGPSQGVANQATASSWHWISKLSRNISSALHPGSLTGLFTRLCKGARWEAKLWDRSDQGCPCCFPSTLCVVERTALQRPCTFSYP